MGSRFQNFLGILIKKIDFDFWILIKKNLNRKKIKKLVSYKKIDFDFSILIKKFKNFDPNGSQKNFWKNFLIHFLECDTKSDSRGRQRNSVTQEAVRISSRGRQLTS